ncbi:MAG TPA: PDZ domain-containing protein [Pirellulaceae bacterium]|nr:PDZ domain-containing protein [Pirellulaceae bacterium]
MNVRISLLACAFAASAVFSAIAWGQNLDKVEKRLDKTDRTKAAPAGERAPPIDLDPPALPPRIGDGDLPPPAGDADAPTSGYLGVVLEEVDGALAVTEVAADSPAEKAGLKAGDRIIAVNKSPVKDIDELGRRMEPVPPGGKLTLTIEREGKESTIVATLGQPPEAPKNDAGGIDLGEPARPPADEPARGPAEAGEHRASLGISVVTFANELRLRSDVPARSGALVTMIRPDSPAAKERLPLGAVIVAYDGQKVETAEELVEFIRQSRQGQEVELTYYQGPTLRRKNVKLAAAADSSLSGPGYGGLLRDRSLIGRAERAIEGLTHPGAGVSGGAIPGAAAGTTEASLVEQLEELKARVETLEARLKELESKLPAERPAADTPAAPGADEAGAGEPAPIVPRARTPAASPPRRPAGAKVGDE